MKAAQRIGIQLRRARCTASRQKSHDLAREAVGLHARVGPPIERCSGSLGLCIGQCCERLQYSWLVITQDPECLLLAINDNRGDLPSGE